MKIPSAKAVDRAAERLAKNAGEPVERVNKAVLRKVLARASEGEPPVTLP